MTWVLIIWLTTWSGGIHGNSVTIHSVSGFSSEISCNSAAIRMTTENMKGREPPKIWTVCVLQ